MNNVFKIDHVAICSLVVVVAFIFTSCAKTITFPVSEVIPTAEAKAKITTDKNKNYVINLTVDYLASPDRLKPSKKTYVVWLETEDSGIQNVGQMIPSKKNKASLTVIKSAKPIRIIVTAENDADAQKPGSLEVLRSKKF